MIHLRPTGVVFGAVLLAGCSVGPVDGPLTHPTRQPVRVEAPGCAPHTVHCRVATNRSSKETTLPSSFDIMRDDGLLIVRCRHTESGRTHEADFAPGAGDVTGNRLVDALLFDAKEYPRRIEVPLCNS